MNIDYADLQEFIRYRFYRCNEMTAQQAEDYAALAVIYMKQYLKPYLMLVDNKEAA